MEHLQPVATDERHEILDVLRGFALFGVLLANLTVTVEIGLAGREALPSAGVDAVTSALLVLFVRSKFISLFAFLFGFGFAVQAGRAAARGESIVPLYRRRLLVLAGIGVLHLVFVWWGDILLGYAAGGFLLLALRRRPAEWLRKCGLALALTGYSGFAVYRYLGSLVHSTSPLAVLPAASEAFASGSYLDVVATNLVLYRLLFELGAFPLNLLVAYGLFLLGLAAGKRRLFLDDDDERLAKMRRLLPWGFVAGLACNLVYALFKSWPVFDPTSPQAFLAIPFSAVGPPALAASYAVSVVLLLRRPRWRPWLRPLAGVGRMALTSYLTQSFFYLFLLCGPGLGLLGRIGSTVAALIAVAIFVLQVGLSALWLRHFRHGPAEWVWRRLTYGRLPPWTPWTCHPFHKSFPGSDLEPNGSDGARANRRLQPEVLAGGASTPHPCPSVRPRNGPEPGGPGRKSLMPKEL